MTHPHPPSSASEAVTAALTEDEMRQACKIARVEFKEVVKIKAHGPPSGFVVVLQVTFDDGEERNLPAMGYKPNKSAMEIEGVAKSAPKTIRPFECKSGDRLEGYNGRFEVVVPDKRGMAKLKNLATGKTEDWNAYANSFRRIS